MKAKGLFIFSGFWLLTAAMVLPQVKAQSIDLPSSKTLLAPAPGLPQRLNSLPVSMAASPDGRYIVTVNAGFATFESRYMQSLAVLDTQTGKLEDFPEPRTLVGAQQTLYSGLAFSKDGKHLYASLASTSDPEGKKPNDTGSGILVDSFTAGKIVPERLIALPLQNLAAGRRSQLTAATGSDKAIPFPADIALIQQGGAEKLLVAGNLSDDVWLIDPASGKIEKRFDLSENEFVPSTYPIALAVNKAGTRAFVALWNASEIVELNLSTGQTAAVLPLLKPHNPVSPGSHPCAFAFSPDEKTLFVALSNRDAVAAVDLSKKQLAIKGYLDTRLPGQSYFGAEPVALALNPDGSRLYVANMASNAIAVLDPGKIKKSAAHHSMVEPLGFVPTEWMPISMAFNAGKIYLATAKGKGTGPNNFPQRETQETAQLKVHRPSTYIATLLYGSLATLDAQEIETHLKPWTQAVLEANRMKAGDEKIAFALGKNPIRHVIYIIKENRTYDQVFGDLTFHDKKVANGDPALAMYGAAITPNLHKLALQFGVLDNFFDSGEVSGDGHVWSTAAIGTDYLEKTWQQNYRGNQRTYDYEGVVADGYPLLQKIADVNEPASGYLWGNLAAHNQSYIHFGEYVASTFCNEKKTANPQLGPMLAGANCEKSAVAPGENLPAEWGGGVNKWPWPIPLLAANVATKPELVGHFAREYPDFNLHIPDQIRADIFFRHLKNWVDERNQGKDNMPGFIMLRFGNDHTAGTTPGGPTPSSSVADNDLAVGRAVEAISHSPYWDDTAFFILEDDAQDGADHVDAHRSIAVVVSKYAPQSADGAPFVDSRFYSTVSVVRTMETLLGLPPMNNNDAFSSLISTLFTGKGDQPAFDADYSNRDNGLIYKANQKTAVGAKESSKMDFRHADHADTRKLNVILWKDAMGDKPVPAMLYEKHKKSKDDDD
jgi:DNA-binding beta-propeller fold protein YncE